MDEAQLVHRLNSQRELRHIKSSNVLGEDLILDQHRHQIATSQKFHEHVEKGRILKRSVQLHKPGAIGVGQDIALRTHVGKLILFELQDYSANARLR